MPRKTTDIRVLQGRENRNNKIRKRFAYLFDTKQLRYEIAMEKLILEFGLAENTISQIINNHGNYKAK